MERSLSKAHSGALLWFASHAGKEIDWPAPRGGMHLVNKAKGIHKPAGLKYVLSVRQSMSGPYEDMVGYLPDGAWEILYAQEGADPGYFTNRALMSCMQDSVPIGVLVQVQKKPNSRYKVLGLGSVVDWSGGVFSIREFKLAGGVDKQPDLPSGFFDPTDDQDARRQMLQSIVVRCGQPAFRRELLRAYGGACAISGCTVVEALEAAHILPFRGERTNHVQNGLLLRADLHTLFDLGMIEIDPDSLKVGVSPSICDEMYTVYDGKQFSLPSNPDDQPSREALRIRLGRQL